MASDPRMKRYFYRSLLLAGLGLATSHVVAWGSDNFILQPRMQASKLHRRILTAAATSTHSFDGKPQATAALTTTPQIQSMPIVANPPIQMDVSQNQPAHSSRLVAEASSALQPSTIEPTPSPVWVKRGSQDRTIVKPTIGKARTEEVASHAFTVAPVQPKSVGSPTKYVPSLGLRSTA